MIKWLGLNINIVEKYPFYNTVITQRNLTKLNVSSKPHSLKRDLNFNSLISTSPKFLKYIYTVTEKTRLKKQFQETCRTVRYVVVSPISTTPDKIRLATEPLNVTSTLKQRCTRPITREGTRVYICVSYLRSVQGALFKS